MSNRQQKHVARSAWLIAILVALSAPLAMAQAITISPTGYIQVGPGATQQFKAIVGGDTSHNATVNWAVGGVPGGNSTLGTIDATGLYTAPMTLPKTNPIQISASAPSLTGASKYVYLVPAGPTITSVVSPSPLSVGSWNVTIAGSGFITGAVIIESYTPYVIQLSTVQVTANSITASGYLYGSATSVSFCVKNPGTNCGNTLTVPVVNAAPTYGLNVVGGSGSGSYVAGAVVPITANAPPAGQVFTNWTGQGVVSPNSPSTTVSMPAAGDTVTAHFAVPVPMFALTVMNGTGSGSYAAGTVVPISANAAPAGQAFQSWTGAPVAYANAAATTITMPAVATMVSATYYVIPTPNATDTNPAVIPLGVFTALVDGTGFQANSTVTLNGVALATKYVSANQLSVSGFINQSGAFPLVVSNLGVLSTALSVPVGVQNALATPQAARHFLQQAAFGPTSQEAANVQTLGFQGWLTQQFATPQVSNYNGLGSQGGMPSRFLTNAVNNPDQLRQRVAFAYSQIFTISINKVIWNGDQQVYQEMLMKDAFVNFRQLIQDVTLSPGMGDFLDMANNSKANAAGTILPNENYAREIMQLFTIGTSLLNQNGTKQLDAMNNPIPTYYQSDISTFAKVYTGWTYPNQYGFNSFPQGYINSNNGPMVSFDQYHDMSAKTLLQYTPLPGTNPPMSLPAGQTAAADLQGALDNLFYHPNVGPFIGKLLIQKLVKSNPSPAYIGRVAAIFNDNGSGVRGDMKAVITAILLDQEARANDVPGVTLANDGHLQEPVLYLAGFLRALNAQVNDSNYYSSDMAAMLEDIYQAPSVFNYFSPGYQIPGFPGTGGPEFQIYNTYTSVYRDNLIAASNGGGLFTAWSNPINSYGPGTSVDLTPFIALTGNPSTLVDALDLTLTCGMAPAGLKTILVNAVTADAQWGALRQTQTALYLLLSSGYYNVWN